LRSVNLSPSAFGHRAAVRIRTHSGGICAALLVTGLCLARVVLAAALSDAPPLVLEHLTTDDGLPQGTVFTTLQDSQGFVWFGTEDGLVRYDGHELHRYAYSRSARGGLPGNFINQVAEDAHHDLWIAIKDAGLARWNRSTDTFTVYRHDAANPDSLSSDHARALLVDLRGRIWVGTSDAGVNILDPASGRVEHLRHNDADPESLIDDKVFALALDRSGTLWVSTEGGLDRWQAERRAFFHIRHAAGDARTLSGAQVSQVIEDQGGTMWVGTFDGGLDRMDRGGRVLQNYRHDARDPASLSSDDTRAILEDHAGHLWVGTADGLDLLDRATGRFTHYKHEASDAGSLRDSYVMSLYEDAAGLVWIGTRAGGVSRWNPRSWELGAHRPAWLGDKLVTAFADAPNGRIWIASLGGGLAQFDAANGELKDLDAILARPNALGDRRVMSLRADRHGALWIGTMASGLHKLTANGHLESIRALPGDPHGLSAAGIMTIFESRRGQIWIGTHGGGANVLDPVSGLIRQLPYEGAKAGAISAASVSAIAEDLQGHLWFGTDGGGLNLARADGTVIQVYRHDPADPSSLPANTVYALTLDTQGHVWVATDGGGLAMVVGSADAPKAIRFKVVAREDGLSSDTIYGALTDSRGRLWLSSNAGLMRFDPESRAVKTYHREHGLQGEEFNSGAYFRLADGRLCFGGPGGFNVFDPARLTENQRAPHLALTRVDVLGVPLASLTPYWLLPRLAVDYRASIISLDFSTLDFTSPKRNRLAYRMAGLTDRWIDLGTQHRITLTNLEAGDHVLEVRAASADSVWSETPLRLTIHRDPAPWRSRGAYAAYAVVALILAAYVLSLQRRRFQRIALAQRRLESEVALRTRELVESNRQLAEAAQAKSDFLARMSHELRTPMNGVVGMTELLARTTLSAAQARLTQTIRSSTQILLRIVNDLLDLSKINAGKVELEALPFDLMQAMEECTALFASAAADKGVELIVCPPPPSCRRLIGDPLRVRQILMNLVGNAVKFTAQGEIVVRAEAEAGGAGHAAVRLSVADTGIGMDAATVAKIFEPFTQADESTTRRYGGSGLGLAICRELTVLMGGSVSVDSRLGGGSKFSVSLVLPLAADAADPEPAIFPTGPVTIVTRRPALAEALRRHLSMWGLTVTEYQRDHPAARSDGRHHLMIVDAGSEQALLKTCLELGETDRPALVVLASPGELGPLDLRGRLPAELIVPKPVLHDVLRDALGAARGLAGALPARAPFPRSTETRLSGHVLLVEDEPVNAAVAEGYLAELGCTSVWVEDGSEAIARSAAERFDLILMDLSMPTMDGIATTALIRQREASGRRVPIVALTAHDAATYRSTCLAAGMDDILSKPYSLADCTQLLRRWLDGEAPAAADDDALADVDRAAVAGLRSLRSGGSEDLYDRLVDLFKTSSAAALNQLGAAIQAGDLAAACAVAHKLKASAANVGAVAFSNDVRQLEEFGAAGDARGAQRLYGRLARAHPRLMEELQRLQLRASA
jgi:signal transduction histidine kinase/ligand-binding sensor domain-containing protein/CheY-like chemotaxis protein/HPt (histidine-containing phosphotransfer) domain-containing protein